MNIFREKVDKGELLDSKAKKTHKAGSYERLSNFLWGRTHVKKSIMTIPYNSSPKCMQKYLAESLIIIENKNDTTEDWYSFSDKSKNMINTNDLFLLIKSLKHIISNDFVKIKKLGVYLTEVAAVCNGMGIPIVWTLFSGLTIQQSYLQTKETSVSPFTYSKTKLKLNVTLQQYDTNKQIRALMPNLIHSLDATSLSLLYNRFIENVSTSNEYITQTGPCQFYSVHDCFGTRCDKVFLLKTLLVSVYIQLYSDEPYLHTFDKFILDYIENNLPSNGNLDRYTRKVTLESGQVKTISDVTWVLNNQPIEKTKLPHIASQDIMI